MMDDGQEVTTAQIGHVDLHQRYQRRLRQDEHLLDLSDECLQRGIRTRIVRVVKSHARNGSLGEFGIWGDVALHPATILAARKTRA